MARPRFGPERDASVTANKTSAAIKRVKETDEMKEGESGMNGSDTNRVKDMAAHG